MRQATGERAAAAHPAARPYLVAALHRELGLPTLVVVPSSPEARDFHEQLLIWCDSQHRVLLLPGDSLSSPESGGQDPFQRQQRLKVLASLAGISDPGQRDGGTPIVVASAAAAAARTVALSEFAASRHEVKQGAQINLMEMLARWSKMGYRREHLVEVPGTMSHRGGILDVFPPNSELPVRIELLGNRAESIRFFDPRTQRSLRTVPSVEIVAAAENAWPATDTLMTYLPNDSLVVQADAEGIEVALDGVGPTADGVPDPDGGSDSDRPGESCLRYSEFAAQVRRARHLLTLSRWSAAGTRATPPCSPLWPAMAVS